MTGNGTLRVRVYTSAATLPLEGATVVITRMLPSGKQELIAVQTTDNSGLTPPVTIETPDQTANEPPTGTETEQPFAVCNVWAEHPGYMMLSVRDVQIFPGVEAVQNMDLVPLEEGQFSLGQHTRRDIEPQGL
ncbi:MAG: spore cortex-lytic protein [Clostridium sp.]|nr:spore cortex-lytic protein [Clostridium sp.]